MGTDKKEIPVKSTLFIQKDSKEIVGKTIFLHNSHLTPLNTAEKN